MIIDKADKADKILKELGDLTWNDPFMYLPPIMFLHLIMQKLKM